MGVSSPSTLKKKPCLLSIVAMWIASAIGVCVRGGGRGERGGGEGGEREEEGERGKGRREREREREMWSDILSNKNTFLSRIFEIHLKHQFTPSLMLF